MFSFFLPRREPKSILALLILMSMIFSPLMIMGAGIAWVVESQDIKSMEIFSSHVMIVGDRSSRPTIISFQFHEQVVTTRLARDSAPQGLQVGDQLEILFDGSADPIPNYFIEKHGRSTVLGFLGVLQIAIYYVGSILARRFFGVKFSVLDEVAKALGETQKQLGL